MKRKIFFHVCAVCIFAVLTVGCNQIQTLVRIKPAEISPFLKNPELLVKQKATFPFHYFYLKENAGVYENFYIAPVNTQYLRSGGTWAELDKALAAQLGSDIQKLANFTERTFAGAFASAPGPRKLHMTNNPKAPGTLVVELAIVTIVPTKAELNILGTAANILLPGIGVLAGQVAAGSVTLECMIRDGKTGEIIAMFANTERDQKAVLNLAGMTWYTSAENNIKKQAEHTAKVFSGADYSYTYRRLLKIIEL